LRGLLPALAVLAVVILHFAPFLFEGQHAIPFHYECGAVTGIPDGGDPKALRSPHRWGTWKDSSAITLQYPFAALTGQSLRDGHLPTWNPYIGCGSPGLANGTYLPFSPFLALFHMVPNPWTFTLGLLLGCLWGAYGFYLWIARFGLTPWARAFGTALWAFCPAAWMGMDLSDVWAVWWVGWLLWSWDPGPEGRPKPFWISALMIAGMVYSGHAEMAALLTLAAALYLLASDLLDRERREHARFTLRRIATAGALAGLLTAVHWVPVLWHLGESTSYKQAIEVLPRQAYALGGLFSPRSELYVSPVLWGLLLLGLGVALKDRRLRASLLVMCASLLLLFNPLAHAGLGKILTFGGAFPSRYGHLVFWTFLAPLLAAGSAALARAAKGRCWSFGAALVVGFIPYLLYALVSGLPPGGSGSPAPPWGWVAFYAVATGLLACAAFPRPALSAGLLAAGLAAVCLDPFVFFYGHLAKETPYVLSLSPGAPAFSPFNRLDPLVGGDGPPSLDAVRHSLDETHGRFAAVPILPNSTVQCLASNMATLWRARDARLTEPLQLTRFATLYAGLAPQGRAPRVTFLGFDGFAPEALGRFGVRWLGRPDDFNSGRFSWQAIVQARPRAFLTHSVAPSSGPGQAFLAVSESLRLGRSGQTVAVEGWAGGSEVGTPGGGEERIVWRADGLRNIALSISTRSEAVLVLLDTYAEGWKAHVDGRPTAIYPADVAFRAVAVPAGTHEVTFSYQPASVSAGLVLTLGGWVLVGAFAAFALIRKRTGKPKMR
jgi:hypothetical protein